MSTTTPVAVTGAASSLASSRTSQPRSSRRSATAAPVAPINHLLIRKKVILSIHGKGSVVFLADKFEVTAASCSHWVRTFRASPPDPVVVAAVLQQYKMRRRWLQRPWSLRWSCRARWWRRWRRQSPFQSRGNKRCGWRAHREPPGPPRRQQGEEGLCCSWPKAVSRRGHEGHEGAQAKVLLRRDRVGRNARQCVTRAPRSADQAARFRRAGPGVLRASCAQGCSLCTGTTLLRGWALIGTGIEAPAGAGKWCTGFPTRTSLASKAMQ